MEKFKEGTNVYFDCDTLFPIFGRYKFDEKNKVHLILNNGKFYPFWKKESVENIRLYEKN